MLTYRVLSRDECVIGEAREEGLFRGPWDGGPRGEIFDFLIEPLVKDEEKLVVERPNAAGKFPSVFVGGDEVAE